LCAERFFVPIFYGLFVLITVQRCPLTEEDVARLYVAYGYVLFRRCLAYLRDEAAAQDAVQEVFVRALRGIEGFRQDSDARTWLCRIADHLCVDWLRRRRRNPVSLLGAIEDVDATQASAPGDASQRHEALRVARRLMDNLDPFSQRLAVLYFLDECTQEEVAEELGLSRRTIGKKLKQLLAKARALGVSEVT
jgi:RNA polymerase sigma-70 factor, ECF subfamily